MKCELLLLHNGNDQTAINNVLLYACCSSRHA